MLSYLIYVSLRSPECGDSDIENILKSCQTNNAHDDITGVLLYSKTQFVQYLEGKNDKIVSLFNKIKEDPRHSKVIMIINFPIQERLFPSWQMAGKSLDFNNLDYQTDITAQDKQAFSQILSGQKNENVINVIKKIFK